MTNQRLDPKEDFDSDKYSKKIKVEKETELQREEERWYYFCGRPGDNVIIERSTSNAQMGVVENNLVTVLIEAIDREINVSWRHDWEQSSVLPKCFENAGKGAVGL